MVCAVDIGGTFTKVALVSREGDIEHFRRFPTAPPVEDFFERLCRVISDVRALGSEESAIGVSLAGFIDAAHSTLFYNPNLPWLERFPLRSRLAEAFRVPVSIEVDSNAAALAEFRFGTGAGAKRFLCLTIGTGIGGGFVVDGQLVRLTHECIGDVGHIVVDPGPAGRRCTCGGSGCAEATVAAPAILEMAGGLASSLEDLPRSAAVELIFAEAGRHLGLLTASLSSIFFPDCIALGGGVCEASPLILASARAEFERSASAWSRAETRLVQARLGPRAPLIGAASAADCTLSPCPLFEVDSIQEF